MHGFPWQTIGEVIASAGVGAGILKGMQSSRSEKRVQDNTEDRQARADERQALVDERNTAVAERTAQNDEFEKLLSGYRSVYEELRLEVKGIADDRDRIIKALRRCEDERKADREQMWQLREELHRHTHRTSEAFDPKELGERRHPTT